MGPGDEMERGVRHEGRERPVVSNPARSGSPKAEDIGRFPRGSLRVHGGEPHHRTGIHMGKFKITARIKD